MKIGLALAGGGVKGAAHIGAIKALEENNIKISAIAGTSIGSVVAALYTMGYTTDEMLKLFKYFSKSLLKTDPKYLMNNIRSTKSIFGSGIISGQAIEDAIKECANLKGISNIRDIETPIAIPAVDIKTGKEIVFTNRNIDSTQKVVKVSEDETLKQEKYIAVPNLESEKYINKIEIGKAVRASCSYPGIFAPMSYKEYKFVDGGVLDNVPTEEAKKLGVDKIITIKFPPKEVESPRTAINVLSRSLDIIFHDRDTYKTKSSDYILDIDVTSSSTFDIKKIDECYEEGYQRTSKLVRGRFLQAKIHHLGTGLQHYIHLLWKENIIYSEKLIRMRAKIIRIKKERVNIMSSYIIEGGKKLEGEVTVSGSKNASLPIIAATILNPGTTKLYNIPNIHDTQITLQILKYLGCKVKKNHGKIEIGSKNITKKDIPEHLMNQMRSTVILAGAILGRFKEAKFSYPGGCDIGARPIDLHLNAFKKLGINISEDSGFITCKCDKIIGANIDLDFPSVGATENIILASIHAEGVTQITNAAMEPEIVDLAKCLNKMGAKIEGAGTKVIKITGVEKLKDISYTVMSDRIEAGTLLCAGAITGGNICLNYKTPEHITPIINKLEEAGCEIQVEKGKIYMKAPKKLKAVDIKTMPYPGFPTDMQSVFASTLTTAKGTSMIVENIFENRYRYVPELNKMGAKINIEGKTAVIKGVRKLSGAKVKSTDLRGGACLILAGLIARGTTTVTNIEYILRGYEKLDEKLRKLGAKIQLKNEI